MALQLLLNIFLAFIWMFLGNSFTVGSLFGGYLIGLLMIFMMRRFFPQRFYLSNVIAVIKLLFIFIKELILSNIEILKIILKPKLDIRPGIFALPTELEKDWEITTLANLITLTPGTLVLEISDDRKTLYIHAMDLKNVQESIDSIKNTFEKAIKEVSRS
ncbi:Na+/H+ antiporter subunit E [Litchfieldia salsa]|uniref:Multisubunit sodium/proton antiporter, MrpE subunit n=1 Tax=Litchfieldia salsa TaxID=930152 RepID=A0A1H0WY21_9BACI|nr:Na+/H+ antiporter subunit E [Litchfieldia salsa]SDP95664.1 multisubunit sodium/proton antiporter, MrpE subunit [Litchfieldia salsa]